MIAQHQLATPRPGAVYIDNYGRLFLDAGGDTMLVYVLASEEMRDLASRLVAAAAALDEARIVDPRAIMAPARGSA